MVAKPQLEEGKRGRAGVPLARAQRLAERANAKGDQSSVSPMIAFVLAGLAVAGAGVFFVANTDGQAPATATVGSAVTTPAPQKIAPEAPASATIVAPEAEAPETVAAPVAARPPMTTCMRRIENRLTSLQQADAQGLAWEAKRDRIRATAQAVLDCEEAGVSFVGDFELTATDFADLHVLWDREAATLAFTIIDSVAPDPSQVVLTADGQPTEFIVH